MAQASDLYRRLLSGIALAPLPVLIVLYHSAWLYGTALVAWGIMIAELGMMTGWRWRWLTPGFLYISWAVFAFIWLSESAAGKPLCFFLISVPIAADICAYLVGRSVGGPRLAPTLSPRKTWSGLAGAVLGAAGAGAATLLLYPGGHLLPVIGMSLLLGFIEQGGDLLESLVKRRFGHKDSGRLIPGHGGLLDRLDGFLGVGFFLGLLQVASGGRMTQWLGQ
jgi:phosphatidate cytidylyltransferase